MSITSPAPDSTISVLEVVSGTASDTEGIKEVRYYIYRYNGDQYWDGTSWGGGGPADKTTTYNPDSQTWQNNTPLPVVGVNPTTSLTEGSYDFIVIAYDNAGNSTRTDAVVNVVLPGHEYIWTGATLRDGDPSNDNYHWSDPNNWNPIGVPGSRDSAIINNGDGVDLNGAKISVHSLTVGGGSGLRNGTLTIADAAGVLTFSSGKLDCTCNIPSGASYNVQGNGDKFFGASSVINQGGTGFWLGTGNIGANAGSVFNITGSWQIRSTGTYVASDGANTPLPVVNNTGTVKSYGVAFPPVQFDANVVWNNQGTLEIQNGIFKLAGGSSAGGTFNIDNGAGLEFDAGAVPTEFHGGVKFIGGGAAEFNGADVRLSGEAAAVDLGTTLYLASGSVSGNGTVTVLGSLNLKGGTLGGHWDIQPNGRFDISGDGDKFIGGDAVINDGGSGSWAGKGNIGAHAGSVLNISGQLNIQTSASFVAMDGANPPLPMVANSGTVRQMGDAATVASFDGNVVFNNSGRIEVQAGVLRIAGGSHSGAVLNEAAGAALEITAGVGSTDFANVCTFSGSGVTRINGASVHLVQQAGSVSADGTFELASGSVSGPGEILVGGTLKLTGGTLGGVWTVQSAGHFVVSGDGDKFFGGDARISHAGTGSWSGQGNIGAHANSEFDNSGRWEIQNAALFVAVDGANESLPIVRNMPTGTIARTVAGDTASAFDGNVVFYNDGVLSVDAGRLSVAGPGSTGGTFLAAKGAVLELTAGTHTGYLSERASIAGDGVTRINGATIELLGTAATVQPGATLELASGTVKVLGSGGANVLGTLNLTGGTLGGVWYVVKTGHFNVLGDGDKFLGGDAYIEHGGSGVWSGNGNIGAHAGSFFYNFGTWEIQTARSYVAVDGANPPLPVFHNTGVLRRTGDPGTANFDGNVVVNNGGPLDLELGGLAFSGPFTSTETSTANFGLAGATPGTGYGQLALGAKPQLQGKLQVTLKNGFVPASGATFNLVTYQGHAGQFTSFGSVPALPSGSAWTLDYSDTGLSLMVHGTGSGSPATACVSAPAGLVGWWPAEANAQDVVGANDGTPQGALSYAAGEVGQGWHFNGADTGVQVPAASSLQPNTISVEAWVKLDALDSHSASLPGLQYIVFMKNSRQFNFEGYALLKHRLAGLDQFAFELTSADGTSVAVSSTTSVTAGPFYHLVGTYDGTTARLFVNGAEEGSETAGFPIDYGDRPLFFGTSGESFDGRFSGVIDEVSIFNRALDATEVAALFNSGSLGKCAPTALPGGTISGRVLDFAGNPVPGAVVDAFRDVRDLLGKRPPVGTATADSSGNYILRGLPLDNFLQLVPRFDANHDGKDNDSRFFVPALQSIAVNITPASATDFVLQDQIDATPPAPVITVPGNASHSSFQAFDSALGGVSDAGSGLLHVWGQILKSDGTTSFDPATSDFDLSADSSDSFVPVGVGADGSWTFTVPPLPDGDYQLVITAMDNARNVKQVSSGFTIQAVDEQIGPGATPPPFLPGANVYVEAVDGAQVQVPLPAATPPFQVVFSGDDKSTVTGVVVKGQTINIPGGITLQKNGDLANADKILGNVNNLGGNLGRTVQALFAGGTAPSLPGSSGFPFFRQSGLKTQQSQATNAVTTGLMVISGNYTQGSDGRLIIAVGGPAFISGRAEQYDRLQVDGTATLDGSLVLVPIDPTGGTNRFQIQPGTEFDVLEARDIKLGNLTVAGLESGTIEVIDLANGREVLRVTVQPSLPRLTISSQGTFLELDLPPGVTDFILESTTDLGSGKWATIPVANGKATVQINGRAQFFRLRK